MDVMKAGLKIQKASLWSATTITDRNHQSVHLNHVVAAKNMDDRQHKVLKKQLLIVSATHTKTDTAVPHIIEQEL